MRFIRSGLHLRDAAPQLNGQSLTRSREPLLQKWSVNMPCKLNKLTLKGRLVEGANEGFPFEAAGERCRAGLEMSHKSMI